jgi:hypothetical protein
VATCGGFRLSDFGVIEKFKLQCCRLSADAQQLLSESFLEWSRDARPTCGTLIVGASLSLNESDDLPSWPLPENMYGEAAS